MKAESLPTVSLGVVGAKLLLTTVSPFQALFDRPSVTHEFINQQAIIIMRQDGLTCCAGFFQNFLTELNAGAYWADKGWKNVSHYYEPLTGKGLWRFTTALDDFTVYFNAALASAWQGNFAKSAFLLGSAAHLVQDLCVPHHARAKLFCGHKEYEGWVKDNAVTYAVDSQGLYSSAADPCGLLLSNAIAAADYLDWVTEENQTLFHTATATLLPRAQRTTAGLFKQFYDLARINHHSKSIIVA